MNIKALINTLSSRSRTLPIVIMYVTEACNLRCVTCSYRNPLPNELTLSDIEQLAETLHAFGLRHIVYSGGEPLLRRDLPQICAIFQRLAVKQTLLTNGLLLERRLDDLRKYFTEIIVSVDGPTAQIHNSIRGVDAFGQIIRGIEKAVRSPDRQTVSIRTVLQKQNFRNIIEMVHLAKSLGVDRLSFLSADVYSDSFGRDTRGTAAPIESIILTEDETREFRAIIDQMVSECKASFETGFISESADKLRHVAQYFEALIGKASYPRNYCNAPMVSAVITSTGKLQPCFFLPAFGSLRDGRIGDLVNNSEIRSTRQGVRSYSLERCQKCVCTLHVNPLSAFLDSF